MARENLRKARDEKGYTQRYVADALGISLRYYQNIEKGDRNGDFEIWDALEDMFGVHQRVLRETSPISIASCIENVTRYSRIATRGKRGA